VTLRKSNATVLNCINRPIFITEEDVFSVRWGRVLII
jgi:hypothetical protein